MSKGTPTMAARTNNSVTKLKLKRISIFRKASFSWWYRLGFVYK